jgi:hypothetical protein
MKYYNTIKLLEKPPEEIFRYNIVINYERSSAGT